MLMHTLLITVIVVGMAEDGRRSRSGPLSAWTDVASDAVAGVGHTGHRGAAWGDFNGDGWIDLYTVHWGENTYPDPLLGSPNQLFENINGVLVEVTSPPVDIAGGLSHHPAFGDIDNDGRLDLYVGQSSNFGTDSSRLFHQQSDGSFVDITNGDPLGMLGILPRNVSWIDYNGDGLLDLFVSNSGGDNWRSRLMRNNGDGTFTRITTAIDDPGREGRGVAWCDFDNDGLVDVYIGNGSEDNNEEFSRRNSLFRNLGGGVFEDVTESAGVGHVGHARGVAWGDINNDGWMDLLVGNQVGSDYPGFNVLYRNNGDGTFDDISSTAGIIENVRTRCVSFSDYDNDGWIDLYIVNFGTLEPSNRLFRNNGDETFTDVALGTPVEANPNGDTGVWCDFDRDGWIDILTVGGTDGQNRLCRNDNQNGNHWLQIDLVGTTSNRLAIGSRITVEAGGMTQIREVQSGSGYNAQHMHRAHFGLGSATIVDSVTVRWPSGLEETYTCLPADQIVKLTEGAATADCNLNGTPDACDIASGFSEDVDGNTIPDECQPDVPGDVNGDFFVDLADLLIVIGNWGGCDGSCDTPCEGDANDDCLVNLTDLLIVIENWGTGS